MVSKNERVNLDEPYKYGDIVYYPYPPLGKNNVIQLDEFEATIHEYMVLLDREEFVVVTSEKFVADTVAERTAYWNEKDKEGKRHNFSAYELQQATTTTIWRHHVFSSEAAALEHQNECIASSHAVLDRFSEKLAKHKLGSEQ